MLEILVVLVRRHVERRTAAATAALQVIFMLVARGICAFLAQRHMDCQVATSPDKRRQTA
jgi:hypothetical protein